jgi:hypothetical protein
MMIKRLGQRAFKVAGTFIHLAAKDPCPHAFIMAD